MDNNFKAYAQYYDLLYKDKNYLAEVDYIESLLLKYSSNKISEILDLGCGTGKHDILLSKKGYKLTGVDLSKDMIDIAKSHSISSTEFILSDVRNLSLNKKFDSVLSLFHVANYQTENIDLMQYFQTAYKHLNEGGLFVFDFWYGPAVLSEKPEIRTKVFENELMKIDRKSTPKLFPNKNIVEVNFDVEMLDKTNSTKSKIHESHKMRYLFLPEIIEYANQTGFSIVDSFKWMTDNELSFESWYGLVILKKV